MPEICNDVRGNACPKPAGHDGMHQVDWRLSPLCECGHRAYDHLSQRGRCDEGRKRCRCMQFTNNEGKQ